MSTEPDRGGVYSGVTFEEYVLARGPALIRFARLLVRDPHGADDLVQDVLARAYPRWKRISQADHPDLYLRRMLINVRNSWWRRRRGEVSFADVGDRAHPDDMSAAAADRDEMWRMILELPDRQRVVLAMRFYEDMDDISIANVLGCSPSTVRTHTMRALTTLRQHLDHSTDQLDPLGASPTRKARR